MKVYKLFIALSLFLGCASGVAAHEVSSEKLNQAYLSSEGNYKEILVSVGDLILVQEGLFVDLGCEGIFPVKSMTLVEPGVYLVRGWHECNHDVYCPRCGGCAPYNQCGGRCKCPPMW